MIGLCSVTFRDKNVEEIIALAKEADLEVIEWGNDSHVPEAAIEQAENVRRLMDKAGLRSNSYGTYYRLGSFENFEAFIETAKVLGATVLRVWAGEMGSAEIDAAAREKIVADAKRIDDLAGRDGLTVSLEYHANTLTDTPESAIQLMEEIDSRHLSLYWQPAESLSVEERLESLPKLAPWIKNVHVFNWENYYNRFPLADAADSWKKYIEIINQESPYEQDYLLEFVPGENQEQGFFESAETLKDLIN